MNKTQLFDLVILANNNRFFSTSNFAKLLQKITKRNTKVYDCWETLSKKYRNKFTYKTIGEV